MSIKGIVFGHRKKHDTIATRPTFDNTIKLWLSEKKENQNITLQNALRPSDAYMRQ